MKTVKQFKWLIASLVFLVFCGINNPVQALEGDFSVEAITEAHQKQKINSYWWLQVEPKERINLVLKLTNGAEKSTFLVTSHQAATNNNFTIDYGLSQKEVAALLSQNDNSFNFYHDLHFEGETQAGKLKVSLAPYENRDIKINFNISKNGLAHQAIGGITVTQQVNCTNQEGILNQYSHAVALVMEPTAISPLVPVKETLLEDEKGDLLLRVNNPNGSLVEGVKIQATLTDKYEQHVAKLVTNQSSLVPFAQVELPFSMNEPLKRGQNYHLVISTNGRTIEEDWVVGEDGKLNVNHQQKIQKKSALVTTSPILWLILFLILGALIRLRHKSIK